MRGRHHPGKGGVAHRAKGGAVIVKSGHAHHPHNAMKVATGEGSKAPINAVKRARGGSCWYCGGGVMHHKRGGAVKKRLDGGSVVNKGDKQPMGNNDALVAQAKHDYTNQMNHHFLQNPMRDSMSRAQDTSDAVPRGDGYIAPQSQKRGGGIHIKASHKGLLHKNLHVAAGHKIPAKALSKAKHSSDPAVRKRAVFAENAKHWHHKG